MADDKMARESEAQYIVDKPYRYADYLRLPEEECFHYEILDGMLVREPAPVIHHQQVSSRLFVCLYKYFSAKDPSGTLLYAPVDVVLSDTNVLQPDLVFIASAQLAILEEKRVNGPPYLTIEILSPSTRSRDRLKKRAIYERFGVAHYWIVDPQDQTIEAYHIADGGKFVLRSAAAGVETFTHPDFSGLVLELGVLW